MTESVPFYRGSSVIVGLSERLVHFARPDGRPFASPAATHELLLPRATLIHANPGRAGSLRLLGSFGVVSRPPIVVLETLDPADAFSVANELQGMLDLPRVPVVCAAEELDERLPATQFVIATGVFRASPTGPDFGPVRLSGSVWHDAVQRRSIPDGAYRVAGFYERPAHVEGAPPIVGYSGPRLDVIKVLRA
jgi:hypothetical protein